MNQGGIEEESEDSSNENEKHETNNNKNKNNIELKKNDSITNNINIKNKSTIKDNDSISNNINNINNKNKSKIKDNDSFTNNMVSQKKDDNFQHPSNNSRDILDDTNFDIMNVSDDNDNDNQSKQNQNNRNNQSIQSIKNNQNNKSINNEDNNIKKDMYNLDNSNSENNNIKKDMYNLDNSNSEDNMDDNVNEKNDKNESKKNIDYLDNNNNNINNNDNINNNENIDNNNINNNDNTDKKNNDIKEGNNYKIESNTSSEDIDNKDNDIKEGNNFKNESNTSNEDIDNLNNKKNNKPNIDKFDDIGKDNDNKNDTLNFDSDEEFESKKESINNKKQLDNKDSIKEGDNNNFFNKIINEEQKKSFEMNGMNNMSNIQQRDSLENISQLLQTLNINESNISKNPPNISNNNTKKSKKQSENNENISSKFYSNNKNNTDNGRNSSKSSNSSNSNRDSESEHHPNPKNQEVKEEKKIPKTFNGYKKPNVKKTNSKIINTDTKKDIKKESESEKSNSDSDSDKNDSSFSSYNNIRKKISSKINQSESSIKDSIRSTSKMDNKDNNIKVLKSNSKISIESSNDINVIDDKYYIEYASLKREGFQSIIDRNYASGFKNFQKCYELSQKTLKDKIRQIDSLINMCICEYYNGNFLNSVQYIENAKKKFDTVSLGECHITPREKNNLAIKLYTNSSMAYLCINNYEKSISDIKKLKEIIDVEIDSNKKMAYLKHIIYILFKVESLVNITCDNKSQKTINECNITNSNSYNNNNDNYIENYSNYNEKIMNDFLICLKNKNYKIILNSFVEASRKYKKINDLTGYYFCLLNEYIIIYNDKLDSKNNENSNNNNQNNIEEIKERLYIYNKQLVGDKNNNDMNERYKNVKNFLSDFDQKVKCCGDIFDILENIEKELMDNMKDYHIENNKLNLYNKLDKKSEKSSYLVKLALNFTYNQLLTKRKELEKQIKNINKENIKKIKNNDDDDSENEEINEKMEKVNKLIEELDLLFKKINNYEIDISLIKTQKIDRNICKHINILIQKLLYIYYKSILYRYFRKLRKKAHKKKTSSDSEIINTFLENNYNKIEKGMFLSKINYGSKGYKNHYYNIDTDSNTLSIRMIATQDPKKSYNLFKDITKIMYGLHSENLIRRLDDKKDTEVIKLLKNPWNFLSIVTKKRSLDLYCVDEQIVNWFYGLKYFTEKNRVNYKMISVNKYLLSKIKYKIVIQLKKHSGKNKNKKIDAIINQLCKGKEIHKVSFIKIMLLYHNLKDKK